MLKPSYISIITPCYNERDSIDELVTRIRAAMAQTNFDYEHIFIDNNSTDGTREVIAKHTREDRRIKLIANMTNYGPNRSAFHALSNASGRAVILMTSDLQDPPELLPEILARWQEGHKVVLLKKLTASDGLVLRLLKWMYYRTLASLSDHQLTVNTTGSGLYDAEVMRYMCNIRDPSPYIRGVIAELGYVPYEIGFVQPKRKHGKSKTNFVHLYDVGMLGLLNHTRTPVRVVTVCGFIISALAILYSLYSIIFKLLNWDSIPFGVSPIVIGVYFFGGIQLLTLGFIGEYLVALFNRQKNLPLVIESYRLNFDDPSKPECLEQ